MSGFLGTGIGAGAIFSPIVIIQRNIAGIIPDCVVEESGKDSLQITEHPVEGPTIGTITDHAFKKPREVTLRWSWSNSGNALHPGQEGFVQQVYNKLLSLQESLQPFTITTGKSMYKDMLLSDITQTTNAASEYSLTIVALCKQIIIVTTSTTTTNGTSPTASQQDMKNPSSTAPVQQTGANNVLPVPPIPPTAVPAPPLLPIQDGVS